MSEKKHILYMAANCNHCKKLLNMINEEMLEQIEIVDVLSNYAPAQVQYVPTILQNRNIMQSGKKAFEFIENEKKLYLDAFEDGFGTNGYSFIENDEGLCSSTKSFTYINDNQSIHTEEYNTKEANVEQKKNDLEMLMEKRKNEIPQPIARK